MKITYLFILIITVSLIIIAVSLIMQSAHSQVNIIFDTDIGGDADDLGALVMLHNFIDKGECEVLAIMSWSTEAYAVQAIDALNQYYHHPNIPIGARKDNIWHEEWQYNKPIADNFSNNLTYKNVPTPTLLYRKILSKQKDSSVVIVTVGPLLNIMDLIKSKPDSISDLNGNELISLKVKEIVIMGGHFPNGKGEWNFSGNMPGVTKFVLENLKVPVIFSGYEIGVSIRTGEVLNNMDKNTPLYIGFHHFCKYASWMQPYQGKIIDNSSFDQTAVFYAVRNGVGKYWDKIEGGFCKVEENGDNKWIEGTKTNHGYLVLKEKPEKLALLIESIMLNDI